MFLLFRVSFFRGSENLFCAFVFVLIYFGSMSALAWLVVFAYVWNITCNSVGKLDFYLTI